jgi:hypothetical protein
VTVPWCVSWLVEQVPQRAEIDIEAVELEVLLEGGHLLLEAHQRRPEALDLRRVQAPALDAAQRLLLEEPADQLDERQDEPGQPALDLIGLEVDPARERAGSRRGRLGERREVGRGSSDLAVTHGHTRAPRAPRTRMVSTEETMTFSPTYRRSMPATEITRSPAITAPLLSTRSRTSHRLTLR